jgi:opacity protein-like surface antigen
VHVTRFSTVLACALAVAAASPAMAQSTDPEFVRSNTSGLMIGLGLNGSAISGDDFSSETESGGGLDLEFGWGFTPQFALVADLSGASIDSQDAGSYTLGHFDLAARYSFAKSSRALIPYLEAGVTGRAVSQDDATLSGAGFSFGGGAQYFLAPSWSLGASLKWTAGKFTQAEVDGETIDDLDIQATSARFRMGVSWYPMLSRAGK